MPWGMVLLNLRNGTSGLARSLSHASLLVSVKVTLGGGLKVEGAVQRRIEALLSSTWTKRADNTPRPFLFFKLGHR